MKRISIIIPCLNEQEVLPVYYREMANIMDEMKNAEFELLFVDDGSTDDTLKLLREFKRDDKRCRYLSFSRNFGKEAAMYAGLQHAAGDYVAVMDADLQDPPKLIPQMYEELEQGEYNRFSKGIFGWVGFRTKWLEYHNVERAAGESKWSVGRLLKYSLDGILGFSTLPLSLSSYGGIFLCAASFLTVCFLVIRYLIFHDRVQGWTTLMCAIFFIGGVQLLCVGILGQYLARIYIEVKKRPVYILKENSEEEQPEEAGNDF